MSLADQLTPSNLAEELGLHVRRMRGITALEVVPILVVEGEGDDHAMGPVCTYGSGQVFIAGSRTLVEQLLSHLKANPVAGCECVFLVDCDGQGKTERLAAESALVVTRNCDIEADMVGLGVARRVAARFLPDRATAEQLVANACAAAMPLSTIRRAAHAAGVSMKVGGWRQLRIDDLADETLFSGVPVAPIAIVPTLAALLGWGAAEREAVEAGLDSVSAEFSVTCMGKDALDVLYTRLREVGTGDVRGWSRDHFHREVFAALERGDLDDWEVGRRLAAWQQAQGCAILAG